MADPESRIPVRFGGPADLQLGTAMLMEEGAIAPESMDRASAWASFAVSSFGHPPGCACCAPRNAAAVALSRLFLIQTRGNPPPFGSVVAVVRSAAGAQAVREAVEADVIGRARFYLVTKASITPT